MTDLTSGAPDEAAVRFVQELIAQVDVGREPSAQDIATALGLDDKPVRDLINRLDDAGYLGGERYTGQGRPVRVTWVSEELRVENGS